MTVPVQLVEHVAEHLAGREGAILTRHGKAGVICSALSSFEMRLRVTEAIDTDTFGTFTREIPRVNDSSVTVLKKARAASEVARVPIGIASEGSFGPSSHLPGAAMGTELVAMVDTELGVEVVGCDITHETTFGGRIAHPSTLSRVAGDFNMPSHGVIVMPLENAKPVARDVQKGIRTEAELEKAIAAVANAEGFAWVESDMRAHMNPTRMRSISRAAEDLARKIACRCPQCGLYGFARDRMIGRLPCEECGGPTVRSRAEILTCRRCGYEEERRLGPLVASAFFCPGCNP